MKRICGKDVAQVFVKHWVAIFGPALWLLSDSLRQFAAKPCTHVSEMVGTTNLFTTTYHPQANRKEERFNRTLLNALRLYLLDYLKDWGLFCEL